MSLFCHFDNAFANRTATHPHDEDMTYVLHYSGLELFLKVQSVFYLVRTSLQDRFSIFVQYWYELLIVLQKYFVKVQMHEN